MGRSIACRSVQGASLVQHAAVIPQARRSGQARESGNNRERHLASRRLSSPTATNTRTVDGGVEEGSLGLGEMERETLPAGTRVC